MRKISWMLAVLMGVALVGCDQSDTAKVSDAAKDAVKDAGASAQSTINAAAEQGQKLLDQATQYIKENKFDLADQTIAKLDAMKSSLPETLQQGLEKAKSALASAKAAAGK